MKNQIYIIAEAGVNHNGSVDLALKMIDAALEAGVDAVKFQTFKSDLLASKATPKAPYQVRTTGEAGDQLSMLRRLQLSREAHFAIADHCHKKGMTFLSSPFDLESVDLLQELGVPQYKIASGEVTNLPLLKKIALLGKPIIMSSGMCTMDELRFAVDFLRGSGSGEITVLHCNTEYPTPFHDVNLAAMAAISRVLGVKTGYSDHTIGIAIPIAAAALGATVIEKHFTLDRGMEGPDHAVSLEPPELAAMVSSIRSVEAALGSDEKQPTGSEMRNRDIVRKSIFACRDIRKGSIIEENDICAKRPGSGLSPIYWYQVVGSTAKRDFSSDEMIEL